MKKQQTCKNDKPEKTTNLRKLQAWENYKREKTTNMRNQRIRRTNSTFKRIVAEYKQLIHGDEIKATFHKKKKCLSRSDHSLKFLRVGF